MKTALIALTALMIPFGTLAAAPEPGAPDLARQRGLEGFDLAQAKIQTIFVPDGFFLRGEFVGEDLVLSAVPLTEPAALPGLDKSHGPGQVADCLDDVPQSTFWVPFNPTYPIPNVASLGQCQYDLHTFPVVRFEFRSFGDGFGYADALDYPTGSYFYVQCSNDTSRGSGAPFTPPWVQVDGVFCTSLIFGLPPNFYTFWDSLVGNFQNVGVSWVEWHS